MGNMFIKMLFMLTRLQKNLDLFHSFANLSHVWLNGRQLGSAAASAVCCSVTQTTQPPESSRENARAEGTACLGVKIVSSPWIS